MTKIRSKQGCGSVFITYGSRSGVTMDAALDHEAQNAPFKKKY
jgi:hypothetical protein